ncbi:hypothetical protein SeKA_B0036 (plasmid) [Salmonella enterica subsp. enterica serovar Kentucky str. CVM29188]|nr:hypothetical protein SeKA_B0036 [Salmonella enterica subsp. enterica serovar Kentucky str. CVM29188]
MPRHLQRNTRQAFCRSRRRSYRRANVKQEATEAITRLPCRSNKNASGKNYRTNSTVRTISRTAFAFSERHHHPCLYHPAEPAHLRIVTPTLFF